MADQERTLMNKLRVEPGAKVRLKDWNPRDKSLFKDEEETKAATASLAKDIDILQDRLYAEGARSLLVILQGTDTSGKDGTIRGVFNATGPLGVSVHAFGPPTRAELEHDYLWRVHNACPRRGTIGIFNRSHYEDVLVVKVRKLAPEADIEKRYDQINAFEKMLTENGVTILKFMLHISKDEQKERLQEHLDDPRSTGSSTRATWRTGSTGTSTRRPTRSCSIAARRPGRPGTSFPPTGNGSATRPSPPSSRRPWRRWTRNIRKSPGAREISRSSDASGSRKPGRVRERAGPSFWSRRQTDLEPIHSPGRISGRSCRARV